ncbi:hypothetical protein [Amycolatopsis sp. cmx-4-83]|uniref:hypothetical protein n=1 Tax=Amycolatopsis sp. cmx-4-83 TaxID=2790940 RepID=UPI003978ECA2
MRIQTKRTLKVALVSGGLLMLGTGVASAAETATPDVPASSLGQLATGLHGVADGVNGASGDLQSARPLQQATPVADLQHPVQALGTVLPTDTRQQRPGPVADAPATATVLHTVPVHLFQHDLAPSADVDGDLPEQDLTAPLGSELAASDLPVLPVVLPLTATPGTLPGQAAVTPIVGQLAELPLRGDVSAQPLNPSAGTRVTGLRTSAAPHGQRADAGTIPLLGGLLPSTGGILPTRMPGLTGVPDVAQLTSLAGLTQLAGSTPLTHGGRYNAGALTSPVSQHGSNSLESATALLSK